MKPASLLLLLVAAFLHAAANAFLKQGRDKLAYTWWMLGASSVLGVPLLLLTGLPRDAMSWILVVVSGLLEAIYFVALSRAYSLGDLSQVYPLARGSAPLFIVAWASVFLGERPSVPGLCGVLTIVFGLYLINLPSLAAWARPLSGTNRPAQRWALVTGLLISVYATVDKVGVQHVAPATYLVLILVVAWLALAGQWVNVARRRALLNEVSAPKQGHATWPRLRIVLGAAFGMTAYFLVLLALQLSDVSYTGAVREISVVIGAWIGVRFFAEPAGPVRLVASVLVFLGILLIALAG
jgi:drug/metabolite transporter (DMT)-like permease